MKKILLIAAIAVCVSLAGCVKSGKDYKAEGQKLASQLNEMCQKQDTAAVLDLDKQIRAIEDEVIATGDTTAIADFQSALKEARDKAAAYIVTVKMDNGTPKDSAINDLTNDAMKGGVDTKSIADAIDASLKKEQQQAKDKK